MKNYIFWGGLAGLSGVVAYLIYRQAKIKKEQAQLAITTTNAAPDSGASVGGSSGSGTSAGGSSGASVADNKQAIESRLDKYLGIDTGGLSSSQFFADFKAADANKFLSLAVGNSAKPEVRLLQAYLNAKGANLLIDGSFGQNTKKALEAVTGKNSATLASIQQEIQDAQRLKNIMFVSFAAINPVLAMQFV